MKHLRKEDQAAPVVLFAYNRPWHTRKTVESLQKNELAKESELFVFCDGPKSEEDEECIAEVRNYVNSLTGFKSIHITYRERNLGLAESIISGVTEIVNRYGRIIVVEDDLVSSVNFLQFMNKALMTYEGRKDIFSVTGYNFLSTIPATYKEHVFLSHRPSSWGWGTWADRWRQTDWEVKDYQMFIRNNRDIARFNRGGDDLTRMLIRQMSGALDSWGIRWCYTHFAHNAYCVVPIVSKINNIGFDDSGTHCKISGKYNVALDDGTKHLDLPHEIRINDDISKAVYEFHKFSILQKIRFRFERRMAIRDKPA